MGLTDSTLKDEKGALDRIDYWFGVALLASTAIITVATFASGVCRSSM